MNSIINHAVKILKKGNIIAFPTETVYGLGADAKKNEAILKIFKLKKRPTFNPLICHFKNINEVKKQVVFTKKAKILADKFWPGPLTLILKKRKNGNISNLASSGLDTLACRIPSNKIALKILNEFNGVIAAPSANLSSKLSSTSKKHVVKNFGRKIFIVDGGLTNYGIESTIVDLSKKIPIVLRPGAIKIENIQNIFPNLRLLNNKKNTISSPGQLKKHYCPSIPIRLNVKKVRKNEVLLNFGKNSLHSNIKELNLSENSDLDEAAKKFFEYLHKLDNEKYHSIAVAPIKNTGMGIAINDRLKRAASNE